ncbi:hypothetical protein ACQY0O_000287 [Thecaphora frezii]
MHPITLLVALLSLLTLASGATTPSLPRSTSPLPYQYFHFNWSGASSASCWLSKQPFQPDGHFIDLKCILAKRISHLPDRQTYECEGSREEFCKECRRLSNAMEPKDRGKYQIQGC